MKINRIKFFKLNDLCTDIIDCPHSTPKWKNYGIPIVRNYNLKNITIEKNNLSYVDKETYFSRIKRANPEEGDIIISREAPMGVVGIVPKDFICCLGQRLVLLKVNKKIISPHYLAYVLISDYVQKQIKVINKTGSIVSNLNIPDLKNLIIPVLDEEKLIGKSLIEIDKKIELNNKINFELETMAKTIYDYWFLQFEFPNEEGKPYKSSGGKMVWNDELKIEIPEGWEVRKLEDIFSFEKGRIPKILYPVYQEGLIPYITIDVANNNKAQFCDLENMILCKEEVIMVMDGAASGDIYIGNTGAIGSTFSVLRIKRDDISNSLLYCLLNSLKAIYKKVNTGSTVPHANKKYIESMYIPLAKNMEKFSKTFENFYVQIIKNRKENQELTSLRDFLLPLLMNGQVGFKE